MSELSQRKLNILVTGAGSVMGQSLFKALNFSSYKDRIRLFYTNSEPVGAALFFNSTGFYDLKVEKTFIVPVAKSPDYISTLEKICADEKIDLIFGGTEHEIYALATLKNKPGFENKVMGLPLSFVDITTDKFKLGTFFDKHGIAGPKTALYKEVAAFTEEFGYPIILKPRKSSASRHIVVAFSGADLPKTLFADPDDIVVQTYIGKAEEEYTVGCFLDAIDRQDHYIIMKRTLTVDGASGQGLVVNNPTIEAYCRQIMGAFITDGFKGGAFNVQLRMQDDKSPMAFEINGRFSSTEGPRAKLGFNALEACIANYIEGRAYGDLAPKIGANFLRYYEEVYW